VEDFNGTSSITWGAMPVSAQSDSFSAANGSLYAQYTITGYSGNVYVYGRDFSTGHLSGFIESDTLAGQGICFTARGADVLRIYLTTNDHINPNQITRHLYMQITLDSAWQWFYLPWKDFGYTSFSSDRPALTSASRISALIFWPQRNKAQTSGFMEVKSLVYFYYQDETQDFDRDGIPDSLDYDADNDGYFNSIEAMYGTDSLNPNSFGISQEIIEIPGGSYTGIFTTGGWSDEYLDFLKRSALKPAFIAVWADHWGDGNDFYHFDKPLCQWIIREQAIPFYIWTPANSSSPGGVEAFFDTTYSYQGIIEGKYDTLIVENMVNPVREFKMPLILDILGEYNSTGIFRFGQQEISMPPPDSCSFMGPLSLFCGSAAFCDTVAANHMNDLYGDPAVPDGPERMRDAYMHVVDLFRERNVNNLIYTMHAAPYNDFGSWNRLENYYPPQDYIQWHSTSAHFGFRQGQDMTLARIIQETYTEMLQLYPAKPVFLLEFALHSDSLGVRDMSNIMDTAFCRNIPVDFPMVKGWTYVNSDRYDADYVSTSLELDEQRLNELNRFNQCLQEHSAAYINRVTSGPAAGTGNPEKPFLKKKKGAGTILVYISGWESLPFPQTALSRHREFIIYDVSGKTVQKFSGKLSTAPGTACSQEVPLPPGIYFIQVLEY
jgi:hypothetical protein